MVGVAQLAERRIVVPDAVGSSPISHPILKMRGRQGAGLLHHRDGGMWCNGNTRDFDSRIVGSSPAVPATYSNRPDAFDAAEIPFIYTPQ